MKYKRHAQIIKIIGEQRIKTHEQLIEELNKAGYDVTQATVSRDIKELGLIKAPTPNGPCYAMPKESFDMGEKHLDIFSDSVLSIASALHTVVVRTYPGVASAVAASIDSVLRAEILGSIAGDDTILIIAQDEDAADSIASRLRKIFRSR